jgi:aarF domain-containing kinase
VQAFVNADYEGVADALVRMGATSGTVDKAKFGRELEAVIRKISTIQPEVTIQATGDGDRLSARLTVDERETTEMVLEIVDVAEKNGLQLPREFGLLLKQALYFDRYQKLLAPSLDPLRDSRVKDALNTELGGGSRGNGAVRSRVLGPNDQIPTNVIDVDLIK